MQYVYVILHSHNNKHIIKNNKMESGEMVNTELGIRFNYWNGNLKNERVFVASQLMKELGYKGGFRTLDIKSIQENIDFVKVLKSKNPDFINELIDLKLIGVKTSSVVMLYESGVWKLILGSKKQIGIKTRNWLAREVLPSIRTKGYYNVYESQSNPCSYLYDFTERKEQVKRSKSINHEISITTKDYSAYHNAVHRLVNNMTAKEIQAMFNSNESARELIRQHIPENAATIALIDELYLKHNKNLQEIAVTGLQNSAKQTFKALFSLGIKPMI